MNPAAASGGLAPFGSFKELFEKLLREADGVGMAVSRDALFNFCVTGESLLDWAKIDAQKRGDVPMEQCVKEFRQDPWLRICGDLATAAKHFRLDWRKPTASELRVAEGYGAGRYGKGNFNAGEPEVTIVLAGGACHPLEELVRKVVEKWQEFAEKYGSR